MLIKTRAIVLRAFRYGETQLIIELLTEQCGRVSFINKVPRTAKAKIKKQLFQPLTILDLEFEHRPNTNLQHIRDVQLAYPFRSIPFDAGKLSISLFLSEFLCYATKDEQDNRPLFKYVETSMCWLDEAQHSFANFHLTFMMRLSRFLGFYPNLDDYSEGCLFDLRNGCFAPVTPLHPDFLTIDETRKINLLMRMTPDTMHLFTMSRQERNRCTEIILTFYRLHIPNFPELKSFEVLRELFV